MRKYDFGLIPTQAKPESSKQASPEKTPVRKTSPTKKDWSEGALPSSEDGISWERSPPPSQFKCDFEVVREVPLTKIVLDTTDPSDYIKNKYISKKAVTPAASLGRSSDDGKGSLKNRLAMRRRLLRDGCRSYTAPVPPTTFGRSNNGSPTRKTQISSSPPLDPGESSGEEEIELGSLEISKKASDPPKTPQTNQERRASSSLRRSGSFSNATVDTPIRGMLRKVGATPARKAVSWSYASQKVPELELSASDFSDDSETDNGDSPKDELENVKVEVKAGTNAELMDLSSDSLDEDSLEDLQRIHECGYQELIAQKSTEPPKSDQQPALSREIASATTTTPRKSATKSTATNRSPIHVSEFKNEKSVTASRYWYDEECDRDTPESILRNPNLFRAVVISCEQEQYTHSNPNFPPKNQLSLLVKDANDAEKRVYLRDDWLTVIPKIGDIVHIIGNIATNPIVCDNTQNLFVIHPDYLITCTNIADSFYCDRKVVLNSRIRSAISEPASKPMIYGSILHLVFQQCIADDNFKRQFIIDAMKKLIDDDYFESLIIINVSTQEAFDELQLQIPKIMQFKAKYLREVPVKVSKVSNNTGALELACISKVIDMEEDMISPLYGLKGAVDVTVQVKQENGDTFLAPLEIKTGSTDQRISHRTQTLLYTLLLSDKYDVKINFGLLHYIKSNELIKLKVEPNYISGILAKRNALAVHIKTKDGLPVVLQETRKCESCGRLGECMALHRFMEVDDPEKNEDTRPGGSAHELFLSQTDHLTEKHVQFYRHWNDLMNKEDQDAARFRKEIWTLTSSDRELLGRCFGRLQFKQNLESVGTSMNQMYNYVLTRTTENDSQSFLESQLVVGDHIIVSHESGNIGIANGFLRRITEKEIEIEVNRQLLFNKLKLPGFHEYTNQVFQSALPREIPEGLKFGSADALFRIDFDPFSRSMALSRGNLLELFRKGGDSRRRKLIVDSEPPQFAELNDEQSTALAELERKNVHNPDQLNAIKMAMKTLDYSLILGMPGTGKTTTIASMIELLVAQNKTVLLASFTHSAVDNILLKIRDKGFDICRIASSPYRVHPLCRDLIPNLDQRDDAKSEKIIDDLYFTPPVVATTALSIGHWLFSKRNKFDYCIVDEASQSTLPVCLGPIQFADKFVLVGDHHQLQPVVVNPEAAAAGFKVSLFELLSNAHPEASVNLTYQYRMCKDIMYLSNALVYDGKLKCGTSQTGEQVMSVPLKQRLPEYKRHETGEGFETNWLEDILEEDRKVLFLNTDLMEAQETLYGQRTVNEPEVEIVRQIVEAYCQCGLNESSIGLITAYRAQLKLLKKATDVRSGIEAFTVDQFQGRDKDCIIISTVRSNDQRNIGDLLNDWRRLNVTFTRARSKLILVGSQSTLQTDKSWGEFFKIVQAKGWVYNLPKRCLEMYDMRTTDLSSQPTTANVLLSQSAKRPYVSDQTNVKKTKQARYTVTSELLEKKMPVFSATVKELRHDETSGS